MIVSTEPGAILGLRPRPIDAAAARTALERWGVVHAAPWTLFQYQCFLRRFEAHQRAHPEPLDFLEQVQGFLDTLPVSQGVSARAALKHAYARTACDWGAVVLKPYRRNELRLAAGVLREEARAKVRAATTGPGERR
jgi:hypothetical protein